jgi:D-alanyl-lipoteichoic acid acyltransferase DltB (MBOAT superfamily)
VQFPTLPFVAFFLVVLAATWLLRGTRVGRNLLLVTASFVFYAGWDWRLAVLLGGSALFTWAVGEGIGRGGVARPWWTALGVGANLALLGVFKYASFFLENLDALAANLGLAGHVPVLEILLPLGISFITFQHVAYLVDLHRGYGEKARSPLDFLLFSSFFPQLLIGPICRSRDLLPQIHAEPPKQVPDLSLAVALLAGGLFKKVVLATFLQTHLVDDAFLQPTNYGALELLLAAYGYSIQLYCDFSGYTDMARGLGLLLGFHLPENFFQPYKSTNIGEFWRRWHATFGNWLRDYIYFPLGGGLGPAWRVSINLMITLLVAGFWHGAAWKFGVWGGLHGLALVGYRLLQEWRRSRGIDPDTLVFSPLWLFAGWFLTFHFCVLARILFRSADLEVASQFAWRMLAGPFQGDLLGRGVEVTVLAFLLLGLGLNFFGHHLRNTFVAAHDRIPAWGRPIAWSALGILLFAVQPDDVAPFVYFAF